MKSLADIRHLWINLNYSNATLRSVNTGCVYPTLNIRQTKAIFAKFLWQNASNLFSSIQHFFLNRSSFLWVHTPQSFDGLSSAITICLSQAPCARNGANSHWTSSRRGLGPSPMKRPDSVTIANHCTDQEQKQKKSLEELRETWPLMGAASNGVRYWLLAVQCLIFFCQCNLS